MTSTVDLRRIGGKTIIGEEEERRKKKKSTIPNGKMKR